MGVSISTAGIGTKDLGDEDQVLGKAGLYHYVNLQGGGELVDLTKAAINSGNFDELEAKIASPELKKFMYNDGTGAYIPVTELIEKRNRENADAKPVLAAGRKKRSSTVSPEPDVKLVCWRLDERGSVGETILHLCCLSASGVHIELAKRLLKAYPCLAQDFYVGDLYYGESCLHLAVVNENISMVKLLIQSGAFVNQRCSGSYFMTADQHKTRRDTYEHDWYKINGKTNYEGLCYYGEYPLSFAACLQKPEIVLYLHSKGADINLQDTNGNTALHLAVIHNDEEMFKLLYELGANTKIKNRQGYTVLSLSAALSRVNLFHLIIGLERQISWKFVNITCARYELDNLDSINPDGTININSVLYAFLNKSHSSTLEDHISLEGLIRVLMDEKWKCYGRFHFYSRLFAYIMYMVTITIAFYLRPVKDIYSVSASLDIIFDNATTLELHNFTVEDPCYLLYVHTPAQKVRIIMETICFVIAIVYVAYSVWDLYGIGLKTTVVQLKGSPGRLFFMLSCLTITCAGFGRIPPCFPFYEDVCVVMAMLLSWPYCFFFLRAFTKFGRFIAMIYQMMATDLIIFILIYAVVVLAFSQTMHIIYIGFATNSFIYGDSIFGMFVLSLGEIEDIYQSFDLTRYPMAAKAFFILYMIDASLLQLNLFIAMMGQTFTNLDNSKYEWFRQWSQIIIVLEQDLSNSKRRKVLMSYSTPGWSGPNSRAISLQTQDDNFDDHAIMISNRRHERYKNMTFVNGKWQENKPSSARDINMSVPTKSSSSLSNDLGCVSDNAQLI